MSQADLKKRIDTEEVKAAVFADDAISALKELQSRGFDLNQDLGYDDTILSLSIGNDDALFTYLLEQGADPNLTYQQQSPLSAVAGNVDAPASQLKELLEKGAKREGDQALHEAAAHCAVEKVNLLLQKGFDPDKVIPDRTGKEGYAARNERGFGTALHEVAGAKWTEKLWEESVDHPEWDWTKQLRVVGRLLTVGADPASKDTKGNTVIDWAKRSGNDKVIQYIEAFQRGQLPAGDAIPEEYKVVTG